MVIFEQCFFHVPIIGTGVAFSSSTFMWSEIIYRNSGNFHCHVFFRCYPKKKKNKIRNLKMHFYIRFRYKKLKLK